MQASCCSSRRCPDGCRGSGGHCPPSRLNSLPSLMSMWRLNPPAAVHTWVISGSRMLRPLCRRVPCLIRCAGLAAAAASGKRREEPPAERPTLEAERPQPERCSGGHAAIRDGNRGRRQAAGRDAEGLPEERHADVVRDSLIMLCPGRDRRKIPTYSSYTDVTHPHVVHRAHRLIPRSSTR